MGLAMRVGRQIYFFTSAVRFTRTIGAIKGRLSRHGNSDRRHDLRAGYRPFHLLDRIRQECDLGLDC